MTQKWATEKVGAGKYRVRLSGSVIPGMILGGNGSWVVQVGGSQVQGKFPTLKAASEYIVRKHINI